MEAIEMFNELGYELVEDADLIIYKKDTNLGSSRWIVFSKTDSMYSCSHLVGNLSYTSNVSLEMHKAINQQLEELGLI